MTTEAWIASGIFVAGYVVIATEKIDRTIVALVGAALMLAVGIIDQTNAFSRIDLNVVFLLAGMMITVNIVKRSGLFEWIAISVAKLTGGKPLLLLVTLSLVTAFISALLDNVTTMVLVAPITLLIADALRIDPVPFLISETMASNIGGTATLIGDPPNILIGSAAKLSFNAFLVNLTPIVIVVMVVFLLMVRLFFNKTLKQSPPNLAALGGLQASRAIRDRYLLWKSLIVLALVFTVFVLHETLHLQPATVALGGAALLLLLSQLPPKQEKIDPVETLLAEIDWPTLFFFIGMFIMIAGLEVTGVIEHLLNFLIVLTADKVLLAAVIIMWVSAFLTMVTSAVPFVLAMIPVIQGLAKVPAFVPYTNALWWSLALGACLGANGTMIGSAANMVVAGISNRSGYPINFIAFTKKGLPITIVSLVLANLYVWLRYFVLTK